MVHLSKDDVLRLVNDRSNENRAETAAKIAGELNSSELSKEEAKMAKEIVRIMVNDTAEIVRKTLADHLKNCPDVPHDVALTIANDADTISMPFISVSDVLTDEDLIKIVKGDNDQKQLAVAKRQKVSSKVSDALIETNNIEAVSTLVQNEGADISEKSFHKVVDRYGDEESIQGPLVNRSELPINITEKLVSIVSDSLKDQLVNNHKLPSKLANDVILQARERAVLGLSNNSSVEDIKKLVSRLMKDKQLTPSILLRALCMSDVMFFECALAQICQLPLKNARVLIHDEGGLGFQSVYQKSRLPSGYYNIFKLALDIIRSTEFDGLERDRERYAGKVIERILSQMDDDAELRDEDSNFLLNKLNDISTMLQESA